MGFSDAKIAPSPPYTPPGTIEARKSFVAQFTMVALHLRTVPSSGPGVPHLRTSLRSVSTIRHGRSAPSHRAAFSGPVFRGCALRFAPCARHFSPSGLRCSQAHSRLSSVPTIRNSRLATLPLASLLPLLLYKSPKTEAASRGAGQLIAKVVQWKGNGLTDHPKSFALATESVSQPSIVQRSICAGRVPSGTLESANR